MLERGRIVDAHGRPVFARAIRPRGFFARLRGLIGRPPLKADEAWWFDRCNAVHGFGMRHPIDVVLLDAQDRVLRITPLLPARCLFHPHATRIVEIGHGVAARNGLHIGQTLRFTP